MRDAAAAARPEGSPAYSVLALCRNRAGYEAAPVRKLRLDLGDVERRISSAGFEIEGNAGILLAAKRDGVAASVFENGKVLVKTRDAAAAETFLAAFREAMGWT